MSTFGTGSTTTAGASITLRAFTGTDGQTAGTDGLVPGPAIAQEGYVLGASGDWSLTVKAIDDLNESSTRIATTNFVQTLIGQAQLGGGNANLSALGDVSFANLATGQFLQYNTNNDNNWSNITLNLGTINDVNLAGLQVGNTIVWDGAEFVPGVGGGGGAANLNELADATVVNPANKHFLVHNGAGVFENRLISSSDLSNTDELILRDGTVAFTGNVSLGTNSLTDVDDIRSNTITITDNSANGFIIREGGNNYLRFNTTNGSESIIFEKDTVFNQRVDLNNTVVINEAGNGVDFRVETGTKTHAIFTDGGTDRVGIFQNNPTVPLDVVGNTKIDGDIEITGTITSTDLLEKSRDAAGVALENGVHTGIAFANDDANNRINATVSLAAEDLTNENTLARLDDPDFTGTPTAPTAVIATNNTQIATTAFVHSLVDSDIGDLNLGTASQSAVADFLASDADINDLGGISTAGKAEGKILKFNAQEILVVADDEGKTQEEIEDIVGGMVEGNTETGITVTYQAADNTLDFVINSNEVAFLAGVQTFTGNKTFQGDVILGANATATTQNASNNSTSVATTKYVDDQIDTDIAALDLANTYQAIDASLDTITGIVDGDLLLGNGADSFEKINVNAGVENFLKSNGGIRGLSDTNFDLTYLVNANQFMVSNGNGALVNQTISTANLSNSADIVLTSAGFQFGAFTYDFRTNGSVLTVRNPVADGDASTKKYVDDELSDGLATKQDLDATLTALSGLATGVKKIIYSTANDTLEMTDLSDNAKTFISSSAGLDDLDQVTIAGNLGQALADGQVLRYDGANTEWKNSKIAFGDLADVASTQNVALLDGNQTFSGNNTFTANVDLTGATATATTQANNDDSTKVATTAFVKAVVNQVGNVSDLDDLTDVVLGVVQEDDGQGGQVNVGVAVDTGQVLRISGVDNGVATFKNTQLAYSDLSGTPVIGQDVQAQNATLQGIAALQPVVASRFLYTTGADTFAEGTINQVGLDILADANASEVRGTIGAQQADDTLTALAGLNTGVKQLIYSNTGNDDLEMTGLSDSGKTFIASSTGMNDLSDVVINGLANAQILVADITDDQDDTNDKFKNVSLSGDITILKTGAATIANNAITSVKILDGAVTNAKLDNSYVAITDGTNTDNLPLGQTFTFNATQNETTVVVTADQGNGADGVAITIGLPDDVVIGRDLTVTRNLEITGNLTVNGTTTTVSTQQLTIEDPVSVLNANDAASDVGYFFTNPGASGDQIFIFDNTDQIFKMAQVPNGKGAGDGEDSNFNPTVYSGLKIGALTATTGTFSNLLNADGGIEIDNGGNVFTVSNAGAVVSVGGITDTTVASAFATQTTIGDIEISNGQIQTTANDNNLSFNDNNLSTSGTLTVPKISLTDNSATSLIIETADDNAPYITFNTLNADGGDGNEQVEFGKIFTAISGSKIGDIQISDGEIITTANDNNLSFVDNNLSTSGNLTINTDKFTVEGATGNTTIGGTLSILDGNITNVGDISLDTISSDGTTIQVLMDDNVASAFEVKVPVENDDDITYFKVDTSDGAELITFEKDVQFNGDTNITANFDQAITINESGNAVDFRVEGDDLTHLLYTDGTNDRVGINTNTPDTLFHVAGSALVGGSKFEGTITHASGSVVFNNTAEDFDFRVAGDNQANLLFVDASTDRVGIRTNTPARVLDVVGDVGISTTLNVSGLTTLAGSLDLTTDSTTGITFRSEIAENGNDAGGNISLLRVNVGGSDGQGNPNYQEVIWNPDMDRFEVESGLKSTGNFAVGNDVATINATTGVTSIKGATTINNSGGTADLIVQNNGSDVLNVDVSAGLTAITGNATVSGQLKTDDLRGLTAGTGNFHIRLEDNVANALEILDATNDLPFMIFKTTDNSESITLSQDAIFKKDISIENTNSNGLFFNSNQSGEVSEDATLITIEGGTNKNDVVLAWDTSDNALNLNAESQLHLQGLAGSNALTMGGGLVADATIVMTTAGAITLDGTLDSPTINTNKITNKNATSLVVEVADNQASALFIQQGGGSGQGGEDYLTLSSANGTERITLHQNTTIAAQLQVNASTTMGGVLNLKSDNVQPLIKANSDLTGDGDEADATLIEVERGILANAKFKWDETSNSFEFDATLSAEGNFQVGTDAENPKATINSTTGNFSTEGSISTDTTISATSSITTDSVLNFTTASQGAIVFNSDLANNTSPGVNDDFGLTVNRGDLTDAKVYWDEGDDAWKIETGDVHTQNILVIDSGEANKIEIEAGSITTANDTGINFGSDNLTTTGTITSGAVGVATNDTTVATTAFVKGQKLGDFDQVDTTGFDTTGQVLVWDQENSTFEAGSALYASENARDDVGAALVKGSVIDGVLNDVNGASTGADTISFTLDDANDIINLALGISSGNLTDVSTTQATNNQVLRFTTAEGDNQNKYVPTTLGTAADVDTGLNNGNVPTLTTHYFANQNETADLILSGRVIETIDYGQITEVFDENNDYEIDFNNGVDDFSGTVFYGTEDYGMLVV